MTIDHVLARVEQTVYRISRVAAEVREALASFRFGLDVGRSLTVEEFEVFARDPAAFIHARMRMRDR